MFMIGIVRQGDVQALTEAFSTDGRFLVCWTIARRTGGTQAVDLGKQKTFKFIEGSIFDSDAGRVQAVMLVAIAVNGNVEIVGEPRRMMAVANGLAAAGVPRIVEMLQYDRNLDPIWNLSDSLDEILRGK